ncbi:MAG: putative ABC exporter domain-containing protein [Gracilibacteraceae bacterium]|jgi:hypothetical protein|nr:putative ABC exporter domain-containing protein [Gracilibacteraceae bacterium]
MSLLYLLAMGLKNSLLELGRKPAKLVMYLIAIAFLVAILFLSSSRGAAPKSLDITWLQGAFFLLVLGFAVFIVANGLSRGSAIFAMNDANLLFVSPVDSRPILLYGLARMARTAFFAGFFLLFQAPWLSRAFALGGGAVFILLGAFIIALILLFTLSLIIYSVTNGRPGRRRAVKIIGLALILPLVLHTLARFAGMGPEAGNIQTVLLEVIRSPFCLWTPIAGWTSAGAVALLTGNTGGGLIFLGLNLLALAAALAYIALSHPDYYEDVLVAAETAFALRRSLAEGQINPEMTSSARTRVAGTGLSGAGARTFLFKHLRESFRANRLGLWGLSSVLTVAGAALLALFLRRDGLSLILQLLMWMQIFLIGTGRGLKELYMHYIYLIPAPSFAKIVWSNLETVGKVFGESLFIFGVVAALTGGHPLLAAAAVVVYTLFSLLLLGVNCLWLRLVGVDLSAGVLLLLYVVAVMLIMAPGIALALFASAFLLGDLLAAPWDLFVGLAVLAAWELAAALVCFALARGVLHNCDMPVPKLRES